MLVIPQLRQGRYVWDDVYVGKSTQAQGGSGLFAKCLLEPGLMFPIGGCRAAPDLAHQSHTYQIQTSEGKVLINGSPDLFPHRGIGSFGLAVAMMANETVAADRAPNCQLYEDFLVVFRRIHKDDELLTYYGPTYEKTRREAGYRDRRSPEDRDRDLDAWRTMRSRLSIPPKDQRQALVDGIDAEVRRLVETEQQEPSPVSVPPPPSASPRQVTLPPPPGRPALAASLRQRPTLVLHPWVIHWMCQGMYNLDQRTEKRAFAAGRLPLRINIMAGSAPYSRAPAVAEFVRQVRNALPSHVADELPSHIVPGRVYCTCTAERELTKSEAKANPKHLKLAKAKYTVLLTKFIVLPGDGLEVQVERHGIRFHVLTAESNKRVRDMESHVLEMFGYEP